MLMLNRREGGIDVTGSVRKGRVNTDRRTDIVRDVTWLPPVTAWDWVLFDVGC